MHLFYFPEFWLSSKPQNFTSAATISAGAEPVLEVYWLYRVLLSTVRIYLTEQGL